MIYFIAPRPKKENEGFHLRVAAIDEIFKDQERIYYQRENLSKHLENLKRADAIYVHSIFMAKEILAFYRIFADKIVTDLHGLVPEEAEISGNKLDAEEYAEIEKEVFTYGKRFVAVTNSMIEHYRKKYKLDSKTSWAIVPIFEASSVPQQTITQRREAKIIYAGGAQKWQNIDLMIEAMKKASESYRYFILSPDVETITKKIPVKLEERVEIKKVPQKRVGTYYKKSTLGFILRDDIPINRVACPTKLIEYLNYGIIPIVLSPHIGDFEALGYSYIKLDDFVKNKRPTIEGLAAMQQNNLEVLKKLEVETDKGKNILLNWAVTKADMVSLTTEELINIEHKYVRENLNKYFLKVHELNYNNNLLQGDIEYYKKVIEQKDEELKRTHLSLAWKVRNSVRKTRAPKKGLRKKA